VKKVKMKEVFNMADLYDTISDRTFNYHYEVEDI